MGKPDMYRGDLKPDLVLTLPVDTSSAESVRVLGVIEGRLVLNAVVADAHNGAGRVVHEWSEGETSTAGDMYVEAEVMWPGNRPQTFRVADPWVIAQDFG